MDINPYPVGFAILSILLGMYLWKKGNKKISFWKALFTFLDDASVQRFPITFRTWAVCLWLIGFLILALDTMGAIHYFFFK